MARQTFKERAVPLWAAHHAKPTPETFNALWAHYFPVARGMVRQLRDRYPRRIDFDDLVMWAVLVVPSALRCYRPRHGITFEEYLMRRVRGAIADGMRSQDWLPRLTRTRARAYRAAMDALGPDTDDVALAAAIGVPVATVPYVRTAAGIRDMPHLDTGALYWPDPHTVPMDRALQYEEMMAALNAMLRPQERHIIEAYYFRHLPMWAVAEELGLCESRVCQIHQKALERLRLECPQWATGVA